MVRKDKYYILRIFYVIFVLMAFSMNASSQVTLHKTYYSSKKIRSIEYREKSRVTKVIMYYESGVLKKESNFDKYGKLFGKQIEYFENGKKKSEQFIIGIESIPFSLLNDTSDSGTYIDVVTYKSTRYFTNGLKKSEGYVVNGMRSGYWVFYDQNGEIEKSEFYKCLTKDE